MLQKELKFAAKPWISEGLQKSITNKNNLYSYLQNHDNPELKRKYNKMKKTLKKATFAAKINFYNHQFEQCQNQSRKTLGLINEITCRKKRSKNTIRILKMANGSTTTDPKMIANELNEFFTKIGTEMSSRLPAASTPYNHYLKNRQRSAFCLLPTDPME